MVNRKYSLLKNKPAVSEILKPFKKCFLSNGSEGAPDAGQLPFVVSKVLPTSSTSN